MKDKTIIFIAGLHRSGTSLLHEILKNHPEISGFTNTGVPEDEGQHLQSVYKPAKAFGGPGKFAFDTESYMDESHHLATDENANMIFKQWSNYWDISSRYLIEKSPPNIVRTRFLQKLFPKSIFLVIFRHPIPVAYATKKWSHSSVSSLIKHTLVAYEKIQKDIPALKSVHTLKYEELVKNPQKTIDKITDYLGIENALLTKNIINDLNKKYFLMWENDKKKLTNLITNLLGARQEARANKFGYSIYNYRRD